MCPHSIYCVLSILLAGGARATLQMAHLSSPMPKQCARAARCTILIPYTRSFPLHAEAIQILGVRAQEDRSSSKYYSYIRYVPGPTCRAQYSCACPSLAIKWEACDVTTQAGSLGLDPSDPSQLKLSSNTTHSGVGYYAPAARTTLNSCVFLCSFLHLATSRTLKPTPHPRT
jgi:hypothetical protein